MQRQDMIHDILATHLSGEERRHVLLIVGVTPEEEVANAGEKDLMQVVTVLGENAYVCECPRRGSRGERRAWRRRWLYCRLIGAVIGGHGAGRRRVAAPCGAAAWAETTAPALAVRPAPRGRAAGAGRTEKKRGDAEFLPTRGSRTRRRWVHAFMFPSGRFDGAVGRKRCGAANLALSSRRREAGRGGTAIEPSSNSPIIQTVRIRHCWCGSRPDTPGACRQNLATSQPVPGSVESPSSGSRS